MVSGAAQGVGLGIARVLAVAGYRVVLADVRAEQAEQEALRLQAEGREALSVRLDVTLADDWVRGVARVIDHWGRLDLLANNAGISPRGTIASTDEALWDRTLAVNLKGPWLGIKASLPWLSKSRGVIVNIGSTRATRPMPGLFPYVTSKAGLWGLTRQVAVECLPLGISCNMIAPGWVDTPGERIIQAEQGRPDFPDGIVNLTTPEEVGEAVVFLGSTAGRRIQGVTIYLDAGLHLADDAGMVYLPEVARSRYHDRGPL